MTDNRKNQIDNFIIENEDYIYDMCYDAVKQNITFCVERDDYISGVAVEDCYINDKDLKDIAIECFEEEFSEATDDDRQYLLDNVTLPDLDDLIDSAKEEYCDD